MRVVAVFVVATLLCINVVQGVHTLRRPLTRSSTSFPTPTPTPALEICSEFTDDYQNVTLVGQPQVCYKMSVFGNTEELAEACVEVVSYQGQKCFMITYTGIVKGSTVTGSQGGVIQSHKNEVSPPYYTWSPTGATQYVCMDEFEVYPLPSGKGCCGGHLYLLIAAVVDNSDVNIIPQDGHYGCSYVDDIGYDGTACKIELDCSN
eukprot:CAMPEP_0184739962 /NCGR_PEP_ID=MMETSP0315-20130426/2907_1 /TAXON_ID=101924 /ORGANISM="Rhodosorus marinus, Strain UTEX LB 2760" /LENGTH=204 /DNA_ID=CAMNT_0027209263 /DNA_START=146 /DNA_END=760 /DNA_ORIENTATION=-